MAKIESILSLVKSFSPENKTQPDFEDNVGLLVGSAKGETEMVLTCLDVTEAVVEEAASLGAKLILSHHPVIFRPHLTSVIDSTSGGRVVIEAIRHGIAIYTAHTNLDFCTGGINDYNADLLRLANVKPLETIDSVDIGRVGDLKNVVTLANLTAFAADVFEDRYARYAGNGNANIKTVAIINGGAGSIEYISKAQAAGADCYISADFPHHALLYAKENKMNVVQLQHYAMEHIYISKWTSILNEIAVKGGIKTLFVQSKSESNPTG